MTKKKMGQIVFKLIREAHPRPISTREISLKLKIAWHTADRYCLKLQLKGKVSCYKIGKSTAWYLNKNSGKKNKK